MCNVEIERAERRSQLPHHDRIGDVMNALRILAPLILFAFFTLERCLATGALFVRPLRSAETYQLVSITSYDATVSIQDQIATTHVVQVFRNEMNAQVESTFIFPLPDGAIITELIYWFNGRKYVASLRERQEAVKQYNEQVRKIIDPALLQDLGDNVFKLNIAPIDPNSQVRFEITYAELLPYEFGTVRYTFPLKTTGLSTKPLERVSVRVDATTAKTFRTFESPSHGSFTASRIEMLAPNHCLATFGDEGFVPDRDYQLRFSTRRDGVDLDVSTYTPVPADSFGTDSFYALWITPPDSLSVGMLPARNIVFTADISSSMDGLRIEQLRESLLAFIDALEPADRFNIVAFSTGVASYRPDLVQATPAELDGARSFVRSLGAVGLTNIDDALTRSLAMSYGEADNGVLVFMTDGYPTWGQMNERAILDSATARNCGRVRIFPFGIGDEVSRTLLNGLAAANGGHPTYITADDSIALVVKDYFRRVSMPVMSNLSLDYGGLDSYDRYPSGPLGDLFSGSQMLQFGRYRGGGAYTITLSGTLLGAPATIRSTAIFPDTPGGIRPVARLWAKKKIDLLLSQIRDFGERKELVDAVIDLSIRFGILTPYTAFYSDPTKDPAASDVKREEEKLVPLRAALHQNYPNPFSTRTVIAFDLPASAALVHARVAIYDMSGTLVRTLADGDMTPGRHELA
jgi:Ca-activated chloride channel family protein